MGVGHMDEKETQEMKRTVKGISNKEEVKGHAAWRQLAEDM